MRNLTTRYLAISVLTALVALAPLGNTGGLQTVSAQQAAPAISSHNPQDAAAASLPIGPSSAAVPLAPTSACSATGPCVVESSSGGRVLDFGGAWLYMDRFEE